MLGDEDKLTVVTDMIAPSTRSASVKASIITDRAVYNIGDTIHFKVYMRTQEGGQLVTPTYSDYKFVVQWKRDAPVENFEGASPD